jgi:hypothetical protein
LKLKTIGTRKICRGSEIVFVKKLGSFPSVNKGQKHFFNNWSFLGRKKEAEFHEVKQKLSYICGKIHLKLILFHGYLAFFTRKNGDISKITNKFLWKNTLQGNFVNKISFFFKSTKKFDVQVVNFVLYCECHVRPLDAATFLCDHIFSLLLHGMQQNLRVTFVPYVQYIVEHQTTISYNVKNVSPKFWKNSKRLENYSDSLMRY